MLISCIVPAYQNKQELIKTLTSVIKAQERSGYCQIEIIIVDGSSKQLLKHTELKNYENPNCSLTYLFGVDSGPYDAMNKGLVYVSGEWIWFLNSGDYAMALPTGESLEAKSNIIIGAWFSEVQNKLFIPSENHGLQSSICSEPGCGLCHQSMLFRSTIYRNKRYRDNLYKCAAELDYFIDDLINNAYILDSTFVCNYNNFKGLSKSRALLHLRESLEIYKTRNIQISNLRLIKRYASAIKSTLAAII